MIKPTIVKKLLHEGKEIINNKQLLPMGILMAEHCFIKCSNELHVFEPMIPRNTNFKECDYNTILLP